MKGCVAPPRKDTVDLIRFPCALSHELRETSSKEAFEPGDGDRALPTLRTSPMRRTPRGDCQECLQSGLMVKTATYS